MTCRITIIGSGLMGHGIAQIFAAAGHQVSIHDMNPDALGTVKDRIQSNLQLMSTYHLVESSLIPEILNRITTHTDLTQACIDADVVIETIIENLQIKQDLFAQLDQICPQKTILCSGTSVMSITEIAQKSVNRHRILGTHFWNPPYLIPLVEVIRTNETSDLSMDFIFNLMEDAGKVPVRVNKDVPGFIANRMQHALWREAFAIIDEGICDAETVDIAVRNSFGMRLPILGPVTNADLVGLDLTIAIHDYILPHINASSTPSKTLRENIKQKNLGFKTGEGFLSWTPDSIAETRNRLSTYLMETLSNKNKK